MAGYLPFGVGTPAEVAEQPPSILDKLATAIINGTAALPKRVIDAAVRSRPGLRREDVTDIPGSAQPNDPLYDAVGETALNLAGVASPFAVQGAAGVFGGRLAQTADKAKLARAEEMAASGADRKAIWDETGWFKGGDDKWRFEIPDNKAVLNPNTFGKGEMPFALDGAAQSGPIAGRLWHEDMYAAYPDLRRVKGEFQKDVPGGSYHAGDDVVTVRGNTVDEARSVALHEMQHAIQGREGFARGGSPSMFTQGDDAILSRDALSWRREMDRFPGSMWDKDKAAEKAYRDMDAVDWMPSEEARTIAKRIHDNPDDTLKTVAQLYGTDKHVTPYSPRDLYRALPGEIEARNVQARRDMTPAEIKAKPPWETEHWMDRAASSPALERLFGGGHVGALEGGAASRGPQMSTDKPSLKEMFEQSKRQIRAAEDLTKEAVSTGKMVFEKDGRKVAISPSLNPEYKHRVTNFDEKGPVGHREYKDADFWGLESEIRMLLGSGYKVRR